MHFLVLNGIGVCRVLIFKGKVLVNLELRPGWKARLKVEPMVIFPNLKKALFTL